MAAKQSPPTRRRRVQATHREVTRNILIDAAIEAFNKHGYAKTTVDQISEAGGTSRATFYLHFHSKEEVLYELVKRAGETYSATYHDLAAALHDKDLNATEAWIRSGIAHWADVDDVMRPVYQAAMTSPELHHRLFPDDIPGLSDMSAALLEAGLADDPARAEVLAIILHSPLLHLFQKHLRGETMDETVIATTLAAAWIDTIAGAQRPS